MADRLTADQLVEMFRQASGLDTLPPGWTAVGAWIRVSSGGQDEANQVPAVIRFMIAHKYWPVVWYIVHAKSAFHGKHQDVLDQAVEDIRMGTIALMVIWHSDRLERRHDGKLKTLMGTLSEFTDAGGRVESVQEPNLGQTDFGGQITTFIASLINHEKSQHISEQVLLSFERIDANDAIRNNVPWGYALAGPKYNKKQVATEVCRVYAPQIFTRCKEGASLRTIAAWLESENVRPVRGERWHENSVRIIIRNRAYAGRRMSKDGKTTLGTCEAVIDMVLWKQANAALKARPKRGPSAVNKPLLANLMCPRCNSPMNRIAGGSHRDNKTLYYRCSGNGAQRKGCGNMVHYDRLESMVAVRVLAWDDEPHQIRNWVPGKNWDAELEWTADSIRELDPLAEDYATRHKELVAKLAEYKHLNDTESTSGHWDLTDVLNDDGSVMTRGQYFYDLYQPYLEGGNVDPAREYLKSFDIRAEKLECCGGIRVIIDGREDVAHNEAEHEPVKCACGCGELIAYRAADSNGRRAHNRKYLNAVHKNRDFRRQQKQQQLSAR